jgi:hypothetical protein
VECDYFVEGNISQILLWRFYNFTIKVHSYPAKIKNELQSS